MKPSTLLPVAGLLCVLAPCPLAQSYDDLTFVRNRPSAYTSLLQVRAGVLGAVPAKEDKPIGLESEYGFDGHVFYRNDQFDGRDAQIQAYAGRDGAYVGVLEGVLLGRGNWSRLELSTRYFPFYRDGFYSGGDFVPTGRYEGNDYALGLSLNREVAEDLRVEVGGFYRKNKFDRNEDTAAGYTVPDDYDAYGARLWVEHNTLELDRNTGRPEDGFILTLAIDKEFNDSDGRLGTAGIFESSLPSSVIRARGHLEWYFPQSGTNTWELFADGSFSDKKDRVYNSDAQKPIGYLWIDGELRYRFDVGQALTLAPLAKAQFVQSVKEDGAGSDTNMFFGGGLDAALNVGDNISLIADYSFLSNPSRPPVSATSDAFGEHRFFLGMEVRFAGQRR